MRGEIEVSGSNKKVLGTQSSKTKEFITLGLLKHESLDALHCPLHNCDFFFQKFPEGKIMRCPGKEAIEALFMSAVKEVAINDIHSFLKPLLAD